MNTNVVLPQSYFKNISVGMHLKPGIKVDQSQRQLVYRYAVWNQQIKVHGMDKATLSLFLIHLKGYSYVQQTYGMYNSPQFWSTMYCTCLAVPETISSPELDSSPINKAVLSQGWKQNNGTMSNRQCLDQHNQFKENNLFNFLKS